MIRPLFALASLSVVTLPHALACGGTAATPAPETAAATRPAPAQPVAPAPVPVVLTRVDPNAQHVMYLDAVAFRASPLFRTLYTVLGMIPGAASELDQLTERCGFNPIQSIAALAFSGNRAGDSLDDSSLILSARFEEPPERVLACATGVIPAASPTEVAGRKGVEFGDRVVLTLDGDVVLVGTRARVASALEQPPGATPRLEQGTYLHARMGAIERVGFERLTFDMTQLPAGTRLRLTEEATSPEASKRAESTFRTLRDLAKQRLSQSLESQDAQRFLTALLDKMAIERTGNAVSATVTLPTAAAETAATGLVTALAIYGVRRYITNAKTAEARHTVAAIAKNLSVYAADKGKRRFPKSAPPTPPAVPTGKFVGDAKTWNHPSWKAIGFQRDEPQYYSYSYETSPDGKRATVHARGDLDGDGVTSLFELKLEITRAGQVVIEPNISEVEPTE